MEFPRAQAALAPRDFLGELAGRLETRALPARARSAEAPAVLVFALRALDAAAVAVLRQIPGAELGPEERGQVHLSVVPARLRARAGEHPGLRCLAAALEAAQAPPPRPLVMGILNVTPDSFSDGGEFHETERAVEHGRAMLAAGADWIDVGGESTRPGAEPVPLELELERVVPVVRALARDTNARLSIDTTKSGVAQAALDAGASVVNDVSAGQNDPALLPLVAARGAGLVLMHTRGTPRDMQSDPRYDDVVREVVAHLRARARAAWEAGVGPERIALDPGFGFGKRLEDNLELLRALPELRSLGFPLCVGLSRKSFLGRLSNQADPARRSAETLAATALAAAGGAAIHRVHEVGPVRATLAIGGALAADRGTAH